MDRAYLECDFWYRRPQGPRACRMQIPEWVREWFRKFMVSDDVEPIKFVVVPESM